MVVNFPRRRLCLFRDQVRSERALNAHQQQICWNLMTIKAATGRSFHGGS
jgi:hypothetical protein